MPNRILRPWVDSEAVNSLSDAAEVFFVRLIMCADDFGRFHGDPRLLKSYLYPLKDKRVTDISRLIAECVKTGLIAEYEVSGKRYIEIRNFRQQTRIRKSKFPAPGASDTQMQSRCTADAQQMHTRDGDERRETETVPPCGGNNAPAHEGIYPQSPEEVIELAKSPVIGMSCTMEQANEYLGNRVIRDWIPYGSTVRMNTRRQICFDLKKWLMRDLNNERERKLKQHGDNRHNFTNNPAAYGPAVDEPVV